MDLDATDVKILRLLQEDGQMNNKDLAAVVGLSPSATLGRVRRLFQEGYVQRVTAVLNPKPMGLDLLAFILVDVDFGSSDSTLMHDLARLPNILEAHTITGQAFCLLKARTRDTAQLNDVIIHVQRVQGVRSTSTMIVLNSYKEVTALPLGSSDDPVSTSRAPDPPGPPAGHDA